MTQETRETVLDAVVEAVLQCPQLKATQTMGQRVNTAKQVRAAVARAISEPQKPEPQAHPLTA